MGVCVMAPVVQEAPAIRVKPPVQVPSATVSFVVYQPPPAVKKKSNGPQPGANGTLASVTGPPTAVKVTPDEHVAAVPTALAGQRRYPPLAFEVK
jgi:hypothetical protein